jgi:hypothetical protein
VNPTPVGFPRPLSASPVRSSLVPAYAECTAPNRTHGAPLDSPSCNPPVQRSSRLTVGTSDANGKNPTMTGSIKLSTIVGTPSTPADEADLLITFRTTDVRDTATPALADYTGELQGRMELRITDRRNGDTGNDTATVTDLSYTFTVPCAATGSTNTGAVCQLNTTADAITLGTVPEGKRSIWQLADVEVLDGGPDGDAETPNNSVFLTQGVFVP